jgi:hypothetical protein
MLAAGSSDPVSSRIGREGLDQTTINHLRYLISHSYVENWFTSLARPDVTESQIMQVLAVLSSGPDAFDLHPVPYLPAYIEWVAAQKRDGGELAAAFAGLLALAFLEGLARRARPAASYPQLSMNSIERDVLPVAELLVAADLLGGAAMLCTLVRSYMLDSPFQRQSEEGQSLMSRCREIERKYAIERRVACQEAAWMLRERANDDVVDRAALATVFYATGDAARAYAIMRREHLPAVAVVTDLVEVSLDLAPMDPLLQAVWTRYVLSGQANCLPERVALPLRMRRRDVNSAFKGTAEGLKAVSGVDLSDAYARTLFGYVTGLWRDGGYESEGWSTILAAVNLPVAWNDNPGSFVRVLDLYSLAVDPGSRLPAAEHIFEFSGWHAGVETDIRAVASASLFLDGHTGRRGQYGRSLAYDSSFIVEPWRRDEDAATSVDVLETHRAAGIEYWLRTVPPFTPPPQNRKERKVVERDCALTEKYEDLIGVVTFGQGGLHHQIYGDESRRRVLRIDEGERTMLLNQWSEERAKWAEQAIRDFPLYAMMRLQPPWTVENVQGFLESGVPL